MLGERGERRVRAHRTDRFFAHLGHVADDEAQVLFGVPEALLQSDDRRVLGRERLGRIDGVKGDLVTIEPFGVGSLCGERVLQLVVVDDATFVDVDEEDPAWLEPTLALDIRGINGQHAHLTRQDDSLILRHPIARGAKSVAVEDRARDGAVTEGHRRGTIPRFHQSRVVAIEGAPRWTHRR